MNTNKIGNTLDNYNISMSYNMKNLLIWQNSSLTLNKWISFTSDYK